ncbi:MULTISPECIES: DUF3182 family protein [unclassified Pseudomonas]|uniref:DUF3182 family protein n=1 Tax=unclassified Pseudomonas TaxID=196821 RepID=UPI002447111A|nr:MULTISPECIES: DUF3182 family protein [unclassified Pseudomonas]MDG9924234.1 DUF3182 family protein [Pseudomonas sp. GD04045]MDH0036664.1 DUF3182 family protein [Pseudomonas sp. GD04019]
MKDGVLLVPSESGVSQHERAVHHVLGRKIAALLGTRFLGDHDPAEHATGNYYLIPSDTLIGTQRAQELGIRGPEDFFGGMVAQPFMSTKAISHPLPEHPRQVPQGWSHEFSKQVANSILGGSTVFDLNDAQRAGEQLLEHGPVRVKQVLGKAGRGQEVIRDRQALADCLAGQDAAEVATWGLVLEENLNDVVTFSVGQVLVAGIIASYYGSQRLTRDNTGVEVYGGSDLTIVRGDYAELMRLDMPEAIRLAVSQAHVYEHAAIAAFGLSASRRNYDVAQGIDSLGKPRSGVLEQSWRIGGASAAEIFALEAFAADPALRCVRAATFECYGESEPPDDAQQLYSGEEPEVGQLSKYVKVQAHGIP